MADFDTLRARLQQLTLDLEAQRRALSLEREQLKLLDLEKAKVIRSKSTDSTAYRALLSRQEQASAAIDKHKGGISSLFEEQARVLKELEGFLDPRRQLVELPNDAPILMFPVRLETRFKIVTNAQDVPEHELWVRIFPDECSIDTFDDVLSTSEIERARQYWISVWQAGAPPDGDVSLASFVRDKRLGAWRTLMGVFNAGRAYWITANHHPQNDADLPTRNAESDRFFVIATDDPPTAVVRSALSAYWEAVWISRGDLALIDAAFGSLVAATGGDAAQARAWVERFVPQGFEPAPAGASLGAVRVVFQVFAAAPETKLSAWSQAAKVRTFPERFVLLGYQGNDVPAVITAIGQTIPNPLIVGPDTRDDIEELLEQAFPGEIATLSDEAKAAKYVEYLALQSETAWLFDFERAIASGLGFRIELTAQQYRLGFSRLMVVGIKLGSDRDAGQRAFEELLQHHQFGDAGLSLLAQGTPTNNTEETGSGRSVLEDPEEAFARYFEPSDELDASTPAIEHDGRHFADWLGIDLGVAALATVPGYHGRDQLEARAMHAALWNATLGYFLESMVTPLASELQRGVVRTFLLEHVRGRGAIPAIRIGKQPYGILPIADLHSLPWLDRGRALPGIDADNTPTLRRLFAGLRVMRAELEASVLDQVAHVGGAGDAHQVLLRVLGLQPGSVEFDRRVAQSFSQIKNALYAQGVLGDEIDNLDQAYRAEGMALLQRLGYVADDKQDEPVPILERSFLGAQEDLDKPLIDDLPLSEERPIRAYTSAGESYIEWLIRAAKTDHSLIRNQSGFLDDKRPLAILYDLLQHAMSLGFAETSLRLHESAAITNALDTRAMRIDQDFIGIAAASTTLESKWDLIYREEPRIAPSGTLIVNHISALLRAPGSNAASQQLQEVLDALELLKQSPTARLERCLVEHLDCCHYRLDAWLLGFVHVRLAALRFGAATEEAPVRRGLYLGAYGWVENLKPENKSLVPASLDDAQRAIFDPEDRGDIRSDNKNAGYVHAPSIGQGLTAAVLRNAYVSAASPADAERYKVNLSSERVRSALAILEGMQQGQGLAELLGYALERGLHDNHALNLDVFIYELRKVFPLVSNRLKRTAIHKGRIPKNAREALRFAEEEAELEGDKAFGKVEARNVVNGLALLKRTREPGRGSYPFGFEIGTGPDKVRAASNAERDAINAEVARIANLEDAVADLALAEGVHQVVQGNYDRAAGALDAFSKGGFPPPPDVVRTPTSGTGLTHRFGIHLPAGVSPLLGATPRSKAEPALNAWLKDLCPSTSQIGCLVRFRVPLADGQPPNPWLELPVTLQQLGLELIDLLYMHDRSSEKNLSALDDHLLRRFHAAARRRPDLEIAIDYTTAPAGSSMTFFELGALLAEVRSLVLSARPLEPSDLTLQNAASKAQHGNASISVERINDAAALLDTGLLGLDTGFIQIFAPLLDLDDREVGLGNFVQIKNLIDGSSTVFVDRLRDLGLFGLQGAGTSFVYDRKRAIYAALGLKVSRFGERWDGYRTRYDDLINVQLPAAATDEDRIALLHQAEALINASATTSFADVAGLQAAVAAKRAAFELKYAELTALIAADHLGLRARFDAAIALIAGMEAFDLQPLEIADERNALIVLAEDLLRQARLLHTSASANATKVASLLALPSTAPATERLAAMKQAGVLLFGEAFRVLPEISLGQEQALELGKCAASIDQLLAHQKTTLGRDFPADDWLYGVARVREKLAAWENLAVLAEAFKDRPPLELTPMQLPYRDGDSWLALAFPASRELAGENLLYTAYAPDFDPNEPQVGLLVDEWTETIPKRQETTALSFHYDRPNCEAPQSLLLVTPTAATDRWSFDEVVAALHEALAMARLRALEPDLIDQTDYARFLPATVATLTVHPVTIALNYAALHLLATEAPNA